jgi:hypothetical protein
MLSTRVFHFIFGFIYCQLYLFVQQQAAGKRDSSQPGLFAEGVYIFETFTLIDHLMNKNKLQKNNLVPVNVHGHDHMFTPFFQKGGPFGLWGLHLRVHAHAPPQPMLQDTGRAITKPSQLCDHVNLLLAPYTILFTGCLTNDLRGGFVNMGCARRRLLDSNWYGRDCL